MNIPFQPVTLEDLVAAMRQPDARGTALTWVEPPGPLDRLELTVGAAHAGAGASTVAVAVAEAFSSRGTNAVTLIDLTPAGDIGASEGIEVMADLGIRGWLGGRRGGIRIIQIDASAERREEPAGTLIFDGSGAIWGVHDLDILVCRATVPSVRRAEVVLERTNPQAVAVLGASRWPSAVRSCLGPALREAWSCGGVFFFPHERNLELNGLTAEPLPESTARAARRLVEFIEYWEPGEADADESRESS